MQKMKLIFLIVEEGARPDAADLLKEMGFEHWTLWQGAEGVGRTGPKDGTAVWPGLNDMYMLVVEPERVDALVAGMQELRASYPVTPGMRFIITDAEFV